MDGTGGGGHRLTVGPTPGGLTLEVVPAGAGEEAGREALAILYREVGALSRVAALLAAPGASPAAVGVRVRIVAEVEVAGVRPEG